MTNTEIKIADFIPNQDFFEDLKRGKFVLVLGAGFSYGIKNSTTEYDLPKEFNINYNSFKNIPVSKEFNQLTNLLFSEEENIDKYQAAANLWEDANYIIKGNDLSVFFRNLFVPDKIEFKKEKHEEYRNILFPSWHGIYTFNFDTVIETIVELEKKETFYYSKWFPQHRGILPRKKETHIAHLHGIITNENLNELVFSTNGYKRLRKEAHTLYDTLHNDAYENLKLIIIGTQFDEEPIDDNFFDSLKDDVTIYHFDLKNNDFRTNPKIRNNPNYHFIKINDISDVLSFFKTHQDKIEIYNFSRYLTNIITNENINKVDQLYVNLFGQEEIAGLQTDSIAIELLNDEYATSYSFSNGFMINVNKSILDKQEDEIDNIEVESQNCYEDEAKKRIPRVDSILTIEQETQRFIIVGAPGSGKTTTLKKILFLNASRIIEEQSNIKIPVLIFANEYKKDNNFRKIISERLGIEDCETLLYDGRLQLLIDGINEIDLDQRKQAYKELTSLINDYNGVAVILTTRKTGFRNEFNIPVYELKELQESEIKEFIHKRVPDKLESLWSQLEGNKSLLELAYNPLYLSMIVIASNEGQIPINRGALFNSFVRALLIREKLDNADIDSIIDILAEFAFYLKKAGMVSIPKEKAEQIIIHRIKSRHDFHSPIDLLAKVNICNLVSISSNATFIHEAFLDYFAAVKIKINFNSLFINDVIRIDDIGIKDITEPIWYEPLIMCGDLFKEKEEEKQATSYFELLYKGILNQNHQRKKIEELTIDDWNPNLKIPCKIAFNLRHIFHSIFILAEQYLSNYMTLWLFNYRKSFETIPLNKLFEAIASLSSYKLLKKILYNDSWQEVWLYTPSDDSTEINVSNNKYVFNNRSYLTDAIVKNISDFDTLCELLFDEEKLDSCVFQTIKGRIGEIESALLRSTSLVNIKHTYLNKVKDIDLLKFISYVDPNFFISNYNKDLWGIDNYIDQLNEIIRFDVVRIELMKNIFLLNETQQASIIINFLKHKFNKPILDYLNNNIENQIFSSKSLKKIKSVLKLVESELISEKVKDFFFSKVDIFSANYEFIKYAKKRNRIKIKLTNIHNFKTITSGIEVILDDSIISTIESIDTNFITDIKVPSFNFNKENLKSLRDVNFEIQVVVKINDFVNIEISETGVISKSLIEYKPNDFISEYNLISRGYDRFKIKIFNYINLDQLLHGDIPILINNIYKGTISEKRIITQNYFQKVKQSKNFLEIDESELEKYEINMFLLLPEEVELSSLNKTGTITIKDARKLLLDEIHPDEYVKRFLSSYYNHEGFNLSKRELKELARLGLVHKFHMNAINVNYGIIISKYNLSVRLLSLNKKTISEILVLREVIENLTINQIVVIEENREIGFISAEDQKIDKIGYDIDAIIRIDYERREGHIRKTDKVDQNEKDYYFHFNDCDFSPRLGDLVSFLPVINVFPSSFGLPKAYRISKIKSVGICHISKINFNGHTFDFYVSYTEKSLHIINQ